MKKITYFLCIGILLGCSKKINADDPQDILMENQKIKQKTAINLALSKLPISIQNNYVQDPEGFIAKLEVVLREPHDLFVLINKNQEHTLSKDYIPNDLESLSKYPLSLGKSDLSLRAIVIEPLLAMNNSANKDGVVLLISSTYRSYSYQTALFDNYVKKYGFAEATKFSARPGQSQHQTGYALDFGSITDAYAETKEGKWLYENAAKFGFSLSYPKGYDDVTGYKWECWHYRYIGIPACQMEQLYFEGVQEYFLEFLYQYNKAMSN